MPAITDLDVSFSAGSAVAVLGPSGSGKSTLLMLLRGLLHPDAGLVSLDGAAPSDQGYAGLRRQIGIVFQNAEMQLFAASAREDVAFGPRQLGWSPDAVAATTAEAFRLVGLDLVEFGERHPYSLSGGERRRLALAGVLAMRPSLLLLDEPFVGLDPGARRTLVDILAGLSADGIGLVLATHDIDQAWELCDQRLILSGGRLLASGGWDLDRGGVELLESNRLRVPFAAQLWQRLGRSLADTPQHRSALIEALR